MFKCDIDRYRQCIQNAVWEFKRLIKDPGDAVDLYVSRTDITFAKFRIRDAELLRQGLATVEKDWDEKQTDVFGDVAWDSLLTVVSTWYNS